MAVGSRPRLPHHIRVGQVAGESADPAEIFGRDGQPGWWIVAACGAIVLILGITTTGRWERRTTAYTAARLRTGRRYTTRQKRGEGAVTVPGPHGDRR